MADGNEIDVGIVVGAVADEDSAKEAVNKLSKGVLSTLKDGYIPVPAELKVPIKGASKELLEAQEKVVAQWDKTFKKGFSSSKKNMNELVDAYMEFERLAKEQNKMKSAPVKKIAALMKEQIQEYSAKRSAERPERITKKSKSTNGKSGRVGKSNRTTSIDKYEQEPPIKIPAKSRTKVRTPEHATEATLKDTKYLGPYPSGLSKQSWQSLKEERPKNRRSLTTKIVGIKKADEYADKIFKEGKLYDTDAIRSRNKKVFTEKEQAKGISKAALGEAVKLLGDIERGHEDKSAIDAHSELIQGSYALTKQAESSILDNSLAAVDAVIGRYYKNDGSIELGGDDYPKGEGPGHDLGIEVIKNTLDIVKQELSGVAGEDAEFQRQLKELAKIDPKEAEKLLSGGAKLSQDQNTILKQVLSQLKLNNNVLITNRSSDASTVTTQLNPIKTLTEKILTQNKVEGASERVADDKEVKASRTLIDTARLDASTGFNTDSKADLLINKQEKNSKILGKDVHGTLNDILSKIGTKQEGDDTSASSQTSEIPLLQIISDNVQALRDGLVGKQKKSKKSKSNPIGFDTSSVEGFEKSLRNVMHIRNDRNLPAIVEKSLVKVLNSLVPVSALPIPVKDKNDKEITRTLDKGVTKGANLWEYAETKERNRQDEEDRITANAKANEEMLYEAAAKSNEFKYGIRTPKVIELGGLTETVEKTFPDKLKSILGGFGDKLEKIFGGKRPSSANAAQILQMSEEERAKETAARLEKYGKTRGRDLSDTGAKSQYRYSQSLWSGDARVGRNSNLFQDIELTEGIGKVDTNAILSELKSAIEKNMFSAQTGGGFFSNLIGPITGYLGMPSLEKSRAEVDGLNQVMADVREQVISILNEISGKEATLKAMEDQGQAVFNSEGKLVRGSAEAQNLFTDLENQKDTLRSALMEVQNIDAVVASCKGNVHEILQRLGFVMPELQKQNLMIQNINAGLDKNGKALKFQTRTAEILNYSFQLMARSIGQMWKNWMSMLNPLNGIKKLFADFASYDTKWQRTMNVIKYNIRRIVRPFMEWLAQQFVNIIGLVNALIRGIGKAFGQDWDLFDQSAANAEKMREELEEAKNVSAGFDELHDISGEVNGGDPAMDLMGDIYTPQWDELYEKIEKIGESIGNVFKIFEGKNFWKWLIIAGGALLGLLALRWLIRLFSKKNPLQSVADGLSFLEKAVGWALLIWAFTEFTKALTDFIKCIQDAEWYEIVGALVTLGVAFGILAGAIALLELSTKHFGTSTGQLFGLAALVGVFSLFVDALSPFLECIKDLFMESDNAWDAIGILVAALGALVGAFAALAAGEYAVGWVSNWLNLDWTKLAGLAAVVGVFSLFVAALTPFIETIASIPDGQKIETIVGTFGALVAAFIALAIGVGKVSKAFTAMDWSAIGQLAVVALVFDVFMMSLIPFVHALEGVEFATLAGGAILIAAAFLSLGAAISWMAPALQMLNWNSLLQGLALMGAMVGIIWVLKEFILALKDLSSEQLGVGLAVLAGSIAAVTVAIGALAIIFTGLVTTGIGAAAIALLALVVAAFALMINAVANMITAMGEAGDGIKLILEGIATVITSIGEQIANIYQTIGDAIIGIVNAIGDSISKVFQTVGDVIVGVVDAIAKGIETVLSPILDFIDSIIEKITDLATTIAHEIGETIRTIVKTTGDVILGIIEALIGAIPTLLNSILNFVRQIGPAIETSVNSIMRTITRLINFMVSGIEYMVNLVVSGINGIISAVNSVSQYVGITIPRVSKVSIPRFIPQYEQGTNYVPNDGLAYLHKGEAVIPKKYNTPYQAGLTSEERAYMEQMMSTMRSLDSTMKQGISVNGQFVQRGSDLVAVVNRTKSQTGADLLSNVSYAR